MTGTSSRMLVLLSLLQSRRDWPGQLLADRLGVSDRTVRRDVDRLRELGYRIAAAKGPDGGYRLEAGSELPPLLFDDEQAIALAVALQTAATSSAGFEESALRALTTVRQVLPARLRHRIDALDVTAVPNRAAVSVDPAVLVVLGAAVHAHEIVRFDYATPADTHATPADTHATPAGVPLPRRVEPHHVVARNGRWYLVAWDLDRADWRTYRVDRITPRTHTGPRFDPAARVLPGGDVATFLGARSKGADTSTPAVADEWPCRGEVLLTAPAAAIRPYLTEGRVEDLGDGRCRLALGAWSWPALAARIGQFDADVQVVGPPELADAFAGLARRYAAAGSVGDRTTSTGEPT
ncbi:helix-turn-helix transcriptional regulator [Curtobacterium sp. RRHDQ10]|uniref:helix-turn-helix transcriptional regulator n=1 Tax=Curtobacterium phyllosphaerae TaxID=3413379 RepID=UPI003BF3F9EA